MDTDDTKRCVLYDVILHTYSGFELVKEDLPLREALDEIKRLARETGRKYSAIMDSDKSRDHLDYVHARGEFEEVEMD